MTQVLLNLVGNAIKFTDQGSVGIDVKVANGRFDLAVSDTGPGIAEADRCEIFEEFQQVDNSDTRERVAPDSGWRFPSESSRCTVARSG